VNTGRIQHGGRLVINVKLGYGDGSAPPRSSGETLGGFVIAARMLDKTRAP
jgi:hypothetical protein